MDMAKRVLILGGTGEARALANRLADQPMLDIVSSLAGRTDNPSLPGGDVRIGGFGGIEGLAAYLSAEKIDLLVDATHPFAARISGNAAAAARQAAVSIVRLERAPWKAGPSDDWHHVSSLEDAVHTIPRGARALVTIGRQQLGAFLDRDDIRIVARAIEEPKISVPDTWTIILARPPFTQEQEIALFKDHAIDVLVTKNAGGDETWEKLLAARALGKPVIVIDRLPKVPVETFERMDDLVERLLAG